MAELEMNRASVAIQLYDDALRSVVSNGFGWEIDWQRSRDPARLTESEFLCESAWVILCSGFLESAVRQRFRQISLCFCDWASSGEILDSADLCRTTALSVFANVRKIDAIVAVAANVASAGFESVHARLTADPIATLQRFDHIGGVTSYHLAKNFGFQVVKPDRHLVRLGKALGYATPAKLCEEIATYTGESLNVVDQVLWRYCALGGKPRIH